jgi:chromate transporter
LVALCQFLPGPASIEVGFALGLARAGWVEAFAASLAFTLSSAVIVLALAVTAPRLESPLVLSVLHDRQIVAVAIVSRAV